MIKPSGCAAMAPPRFAVSLSRCDGIDFGARGSGGKKRHRRQQQAKRIQAGLHEDSPFLTVDPTPTLGSIITRAPPFSSNRWYSSHP